MAILSEVLAKSLLKNWLAENVQDFFSKRKWGEPCPIPVRDAGWGSVLSMALKSMTPPYVAKVDQGIKSRGKQKLILLNESSPSKVHEWIKDTSTKSISLSDCKSFVPSQFLVEPFYAHKSETEHYLCIRLARQGYEILYCRNGGIDVGDAESKSQKLVVPVPPADKFHTFEGVESLIESQLIPKDPMAKGLSRFIWRILQFAYDLHLNFVEINPLIVASSDDIFPLDLAVRMDPAAKLANVLPEWVVRRMDQYDRNVLLETSRPMTAASDKKESFITQTEQFVRKMDGGNGASLKLTILNPHGRIWTLIAGGGASVAFTDAIVHLGFAGDLANYGEYSGAPSTEQTYLYTQKILSVMLHPDYCTPGVQAQTSKVLLIGGGIANFTDVGSTFAGILKALTEQSAKLKAYGVRIFVRRGGPNYEQGLALMRQWGLTWEIPLVAYGPEVHITSIVHKALVSDQKDSEEALPHVKLPPLPTKATERKSPLTSPPVLFSLDTRVLIYGPQLGVAQNILDFDVLCQQRTVPSVSGIIYENGQDSPATATTFAKMFWRKSKEVFIPIFPQIAAALKSVDHKTSVVLNYSSFRSVFASTKAILASMAFPGQIKTIVIIAEGVPERLALQLHELAKANKVTLLGPATVGAIKPGILRLGNAGGSVENLQVSRLFRQHGSVAYVARSGGMSNELNSIISRVTDGLYEGISIGGDRFVGSSFLSHLLRFEDDPAVRFSVLLGEMGGTDEYEVAKAIRDKRLQKPIIAWCLGTCATLFPEDVQFGHAGARSDSRLESAVAKNEALREAGALVPHSFDSFPLWIQAVHQKLQSTTGSDAKASAADLLATPKIPLELGVALKSGTVRVSSSITTSITDDRGSEIKYGNVPLSTIVKAQEHFGIGGVIGLLWFKKTLPVYICRFFELALQLVADHGAAVSGAHNTIVASRAGRDMVSSVASGMLTIGPRFGGAIGEAAKQFSSAVYDAKQSPEEFVKNRKLIMGIGHKIKTVENPDSRCTCLKQLVLSLFPGKKFGPVLSFGLAVEVCTTRKKSSLILNVDGVLGCILADILHDSSIFSVDEANQYLQNADLLNGLFILGRTIGLIGHHMDQVRLNQPLYRHPNHDISFFE
jgi:ATP citrate (pro-S)-lyase